MSASPPETRAFGAVNWLGLWTLYLRGLAVWRKSALEAMVGPALSSLMFLVTFRLVFGPDTYAGEDIGVAAFVAPGIIVFSLGHAAFESAAAMLVHDKLERHVTGILMAPLAPSEVAAGYALAAATAGLATGLIVTLLFLPFVDLSFPAPGQAIAFAVLGGLVFGLFGTLIGLWADKWDHFSAAESFFILPLVMLSGAFFSLQHLPDAARLAIQFNPAFHIVDGFRAGLIGLSEGNTALGLALLAFLTIVLWLALQTLFRRGYKLKP